MALTKEQMLSLKVGDTVWDGYFDLHNLIAQNDMPSIFIISSIEDGNLKMVAESEDIFDPDKSYDVDEDVFLLEEDAMTHMKMRLLLHKLKGK